MHRIRRMSSWLAVAFLAVAVIHQGRAAGTPAAKDKAAIQSLDALYPLDVDPVSGEKLGKLADTLTLTYEGRELRFNSKDTQAQFQKDPKAALAKLDKTIVEQQTKTYPLTTCVVSKDKLGGDMGPAVDIVYKNRLIRFCCNDCVKDFKKDPEKVVGDVNKAIADAQRKDYPLETCVVSGEKLGANAVEFVYANQLVRLAKADAVAEFKKDPQTYFKKITDARAAKKTGASAPATMNMGGMDMGGMDMGGMNMNK